MHALLTAMRRRGVAALSVAALLVLLCSYGVQHARGFAFVPIITTFATPETSGAKATSRLVCQEGGGYIASEPTAATHEAVIETVRAAGAGTTWYAYLGASTTGNPPSNCPPSLDKQGGSLLNGQSSGCYWRWNQGRWTETVDTTPLAINITHIGVTFFIGNYFVLPTGTQAYGSQGGFPDYFNYSTSLNKLNRPSAMYGQELVAVGNGDTSTWSDNKDAGGYSYASFIFSRFYNNSIFNATAQAASQANFWAICQAQGPSRSMYEMSNTSSDLQYRWWIIFLVVLIFLCLITFIVVAVCQDNEDMDEPPEDAPEWAQAETQQTTRTKSFVSTRSFANRHRDESEEEDERSSSGRRSSGSEYRDEDDASAQRSRQAPGRGGSMHQGGRNSSVYYNAAGGEAGLRRQGASSYAINHDASNQLPPSNYPQHVGDDDYYVEENHKQNNWM